MYIKMDKKIKPLMYLLVFMTLVLLIGVAQELTTFTNVKKWSIYDLQENINLVESMEETNRELISNITTRDGWVETWQITKCITSTQKITFEKESLQIMNP